MNRSGIVDIFLPSPLTQAVNWVKKIFREMGDVFYQHHLPNTLQGKF